jgi:hypothetical protein
LNAQKCTLLYVLRVNRWVSELLRTHTRSNESLHIFPLLLKPKEHL